MEKKSLGVFLLQGIIIFLWLYFIGQISGISGIAGDVNLIDEGQFAAWVNHMLHGKIIYKDIYVQYGPFFVYPIYFLMKVFGYSLYYVRLWNTVFGAFFGLCVALVAFKQLKLHPVLHIVTLVFLVLIPGVHIRQWMGIASLLLVVHMYKTQSIRLAYVLGVFLAASLLQSVEVGVFSILLVGGYTFFQLIMNKNRTQNARIFLGTVLGFGSIMTIVVLFAIHDGWLGSYLTTTQDFIISASGMSLPNGQGLPSIFAGQQIPSDSVGILQFVFSKAMLFYWSLLLLLLFLSIILIRICLRETTKNDEAVFLILIFGIMYYATIIGRSGHYFLIVPIVLLCGSYFLSLIFSLKQTHGKAALTVVFLSIFIFYGIRHFIIFRYTPFFHPQTRRELNSSVPRVAPIAISKNQAHDILILQRFFTTHTSASDTIYVFNNIPALYFLLDRENATRYDLPLLATSREKRNEVVLSLKRNQPQYIIEDQNAWAVDGINDRQRLPEVVDYIESEYQESVKVGTFLLYTKRP